MVTWPQLLELDAIGYDISSVIVDVSPRWECVAPEARALWSQAGSYVPHDAPPYRPPSASQ